MINFLTDDFFVEQRRKKFVVISSILLSVMLVAIIVVSLNLYLEIRYLENKKKVVEARNNKLNNKLSQLNKLKKKKKQVEKELKKKEEVIESMVSAQKIFENLSLLSDEKLHLKEFEINNDKFRFVGITSNMKYLNQLNSKLEEAQFFSSFYLDDIKKGENFVEFTILGQVQKGD